MEAVQGGVPVTPPRGPLFTEEVLASIPRWVRQGLDRQQIANRIGCTIGSLKTMCSIHRITLNRSELGVVRRVQRLELLLSGPCYAALRNRARETGRNPEELATLLLEQIANDDLFQAVLDTERT